MLGSKLYHASQRGQSKQRVYNVQMTFPESCLLIKNNVFDPDFTEEYSISSNSQYVIRD